VLAVAGTQPAAPSGQPSPSDGREPWFVQFYSPAGEHLRSMRVPAAPGGGAALSGLAWDAGGARLGLAAGAGVLVAAVRRERLWGYFGGGTLVYAHARRERPGEHCVVFWDTRGGARWVHGWGRAAGGLRRAWGRPELLGLQRRRNQGGALRRAVLVAPWHAVPPAAPLCIAAAGARRVLSPLVIDSSPSSLPRAHNPCPPRPLRVGTSTRRSARFVRRLLGVRARGDFAVLATAGDAPGEHVLILCNAIGSPVDSRRAGSEGFGARRARRDSARAGGGRAPAARLAAPCILIL
jgi:hypothetical protein